MQVTAALSVLVATFTVVAGVSAPVHTAAGTVGGLTRRLVPPAPYQWRDAATRVLITDVWYPAASDATEVEHGLGPPDAPWFALGRWADEAPLAPGRFPLVVLSHGTGGSAAMMAWLGRFLASRGYLAAAVNHPGNNALEQYTAEGFLLWWERARDLSTVIDGLLADPMLGPHIDAARIGAAGFSLGGYTVLAAAGARTDPGAFDRFCQSNTVAICQDPAEYPGLFAQWRQLRATSSTFRRLSNRATASHRDARIRAVLAIAPALVPALTGASLRRLSIPVGIVAGADDVVADAASNAQRLAASVATAQLTSVPRAGHYSFLAACTDRGITMRADLCGDSVDERQRIHAQVQDVASAFFERHLK